MTRGDRPILDEQIEYYRARAAEYDQWFFREGRYFRGDEHRARWLAEMGEVEGALRSLGHAADVLELACGTGLWTRHLAQLGGTVTAVDASPEMIALNRQRVDSTKVKYIQADLFAWAPTGRYDMIFMGFWLSHVPEEWFERFWGLLGDWLRPGGRVFLVDSLRTDQSTATDHGPIGGTQAVERKLNDGRRYQIVKIFHDPASLERRLALLGWTGHLASTATFFIYGAVWQRKGRGGGPDKH